MWIGVFGSPEPKAQGSFSDHNLSVVRRRRCRKLFTFFYLLLKNHHSNFKQTWHKASLGEEEMNGPDLFQGEIIRK